MVGTARERLAQLLGGSQSAGSFSAQLEMSANGLGLEVAGVGPVSLPLRAPLAKKLIAVARPARFGRGQETLSDTGVRDTWEIVPDQVAIGGSAWPTLLSGALEQFRGQLGLPVSTRLRAELHALLVYGKGQFFLPHQDSEKDDAMVGTLVLSLPSAHTGGELVIEHAGQSRSYRASKQDLTLLAFYADCRHEVTPVTSGYRVTLTFNLLAESGTSKADAGPLGELAHCLEQHFNRPSTPRYGGLDLDPPNRLVYLLDHEYTQRGLDWNRLKGVDAGRAALLRAAAEQADCESVLALAEVKETWNASPAGQDYWDGDDYEDDEYEEYNDGAAADGDYELEELIDDEITLGWWTVPNSVAGEEISLSVRDYETCASTPNASLTPYESQYEGYMGNYGNTLDRWYRRAAVVVWPRERAFAARGEAGSLWALEQLRDRIAKDDLDGARTAAQSLAPFWKRIGSQPALLESALHVAAGLDAAETARMLLEPFKVNTLEPRHAAGLAAAAERYGTGWTLQVVNGWFGPAHRFEPHAYAWTAQLPELCAALRSHRSTAVVRALLTAGWNAVNSDLRRWTVAGPADTRRPQLAQLSLPLARILGEADEELQGEIAAALRGYGDTVLECLVPMLRQAADVAAAETRSSAGFEAVAWNCADRLRLIAERKPREEGDWSIAWTGCGCGLCGSLGEFLGSRTQRVLEWKLAKDGRRHVHSAIDSAELPVIHQTRRQGSPLTLVLTKTQALFTGEQTVRQQAAVDLAWLASTWIGPAGKALRGRRIG